jgi:hypothetical protein
MQVRQIVLKTVAGADTCLAALAGIKPQLVTVFGAVPFFTDKAFQAALRAALPDVAIIGCSTAGEISNGSVADGSCVITAVNFSGTRIRAATSPLRGMEDSQAAGARIGGELAATDLRALMVFGPGVQINGSALVDGIASKVGTATITGGLAGDGGAFAQTWTLGQAGVGDNAIVAVGLYGDALDFAHGSFGGWEPFGPSRKVTRCDGNVLYELDGEPALEVYKRYLGERQPDTGRRNRSGRLPQANARQHRSLGERRGIGCRGRAENAPVERRQPRNPRQLRRTKTGDG